MDRRLFIQCAIIILLGSLWLSAGAQTDTCAKFNIGNAPPPLQVREWIKGSPVKSFEKGNIYVVEFWATWCRPCIAAMPHLSHLARKYRHKVSFSAIAVYESRGAKPTSITQLKDFVDGMGRRMDFNVAAEDTSFTVHDWLDAYGEDGIPTTFVIDREGKVAWIGHPHDLDTVLRKIVKNTWDKGDMEQLSSKKIYNDRWQKSDMEVIDKVRKYQGGYNHLEDIGNPDSTLFVVNEMVKKHPDLKYTPWIVSYTFSALLRTDPHKAYEFGKQAMVTTTYTRPAWYMIIGVIKDDSRKVNMTPEIYRLGAECYQAEIDHTTYPKIVDMAEKYRQMAVWYRLAGDRPMAIRAEKKAMKFERRQEPDKIVSR